MSTHELKIRRAKESDWKLIHDIYTSCAEWLSRQGWKHWERFNFLNTKEKIIKRTKEKDVNILFVDGKAVGTISINYEIPSYYNSYSFWKDPSAPAIYISRLAVLPDYHGKGFGSKLLQFSEDKAKQKGIHYARFDVIADYKKLNDFYLRRGYKIVGKDVFGDIEGNFFEKSLK